MVSTAYAPLSQSASSDHTHSVPYLPTQLDAVVLTTHRQSHRTKVAHSVSGENELEEEKGDEKKNQFTKEL